MIAWLGFNPLYPKPGNQGGKMSMKKFNKNMIETSVGAVILPAGFHAIDEADMGSMGRATRTVMSAGFVKKASKKFL